MQANATYHNDYPEPPGCAHVFFICALGFSHPGGSLQNQNILRQQYLRFFVCRILPPEREAVRGRVGAVLLTVPPNNKI